MPFNFVRLPAVSHPINPADRGKSDGSFKIQNPSGFVVIQASVLTDAESTISHLMNPADRGKSDGYFKILNPWGFAIIQASVLTDAESTMVLETIAAIR